MWGIIIIKKIGNYKLLIIASTNCNLLVLVKAEEFIILMANALGLPVLEINYNINSDIFNRVVLMIIIIKT